MLGVDLRDRTSDFFALTEQLRSKVQVRAPLDPRSRSAAASSLQSDASQRNFNRAAADISKGIAQTAERLGALTKLAKEKRLFNDPTRDIDQLTTVIKQDLQSLAADIDSLQEFVMKNRTGKGQTDSHSDTVLSTLRSEIASTTKEFTEVLQLRSTNLKAQSDRRKQFSSGKSLSHRPRPQFAHLASGGNPQNFQEFQEQMPLMASSLMQEMQQQEDKSNEYLDSRAEAVEQIERTIHELGQMYQRLATLVSVQNDMAIRIDSNMDTALDNVNRGHNELLKYFESMSSNRWLILKVFLTLIIFAIFFILFVA